MKLLIIILIVYFPFKAFASCEDFKITATVVSDYDSFAVVNTIDKLRWGSIVRAGDRLEDGVVSYVGFEFVFVEYNDSYCTITRKQATDSYIDWSSNFEDEFKEKIEKYKEREYLLNMIDKDLGMLSLDGGRDSNPELYNDFADLQLYLEMSGIHYND